MARPPDPEKERKQRILLVFMLSFWALLATVVFGISPQVRDGVAKRQAADLLHEKVERALQMSQVRDAVVQRVRDSEDVIGELEGVMLRDEAFNYLVREVSAIARELDVEVLNLRPDYGRSSRPDENLPYLDARASMEVAASYDGIGGLVAALEQLTPMLAVERVEVTCGSEPPRHQGHLELSLLCRIPETEDEASAGVPGDGTNP